MPETVISHFGDFSSVDHQPGNGTRYVAMSFQIPRGVSEDYEGQYLVAFPEIGTAYTINRGSHLTVDYVVEKFGNGRYRSFSAESPDAHEITKCIAMLVPDVTHNARTNDTGRFDHDSL